jgi:hypothetical protein
MLDDSDEILSKFGERVGLGLTFDETGQCFLMVDERIISIIRGIDAWILYGMVADLEEQALGLVFWRTVLDLNLSILKAGGGGLASRSDKNALLYVERVDMPSNERAVYERIEQFINRHAGICCQLEQAVEANTGPRRNRNDSR